MTREYIKAFNKNDAIFGIVILVGSAPTESLDVVADVAQYILFVGGFSGSPYAHERLRAEFGPEGIETRMAQEEL